MASAFQSGAFQASGFQIVAAQDQPVGGYGFGAWDHAARKRKELEELREEIERLEEVIAEEREAPVEQVRLEARIREYAAPLPKPAKKAVQRALKLQTFGAFEYADRVLERLQQEEEEIAVLIATALH